ncbi:LamG domain-containing protein [Luteolibacter arcticus]|uniref:LamG domain-containing protein n=1 Tax=Luteolibacter arcticus TaxID=1581411 RepID=A0ABT3GR02_9BACT|nr:LamG domain-containing protein [Luteolibacter arcticus]MCW1925937.1 LamG domain-containing protein [Luteolibacter arcticus]
MTRLITFGILSLVPLAQGAITAGLVGYFDFEDSGITNQAGAVGSTAVPTFENGANTLGAAATGVFGASSDTSGGKVGNGILFSATTGSSTAGVTIPIGFGTGQDLGASFTVSSWVKLNSSPATTATNRYFVYEGGTLAAGNYDISLSVRDTTGTFGDVNTLADNFQFFSQGGTGGDGASGPSGSTEGRTLTASAATAPGQWVHLVQTYQAGATNTTVTTYLNGVAFGSVLTNLNTNISSAGFVLGRARSGSNDRAFDGIIDEVAMWNRGLTQEEITEVYTLGVNGQAVPEPSAAIFGGLAGMLALLRRRRACP